MFSFLDPPEIILILVVVLVLFGGTQLPKLARNLGKAQKEFKDGLAEAQRSDETSSGSSSITGTGTGTGTGSSSDSTRIDRP